MGGRAQHRRHSEIQIGIRARDAMLDVATVLGAAAHGLRERLDPGAPVEGNGYASTAERTLPRTWREALDLAARSQFLEETLGKDFLKVFLAIKEQECARFSAEVSELDYAWYLRS